MEAGRADYGVVAIQKLRARHGARCVGTFPRHPVEDLRRDLSTGETASAFKVVSLGNPEDLLASAAVLRSVRILVKNRFMKATEQVEVVSTSVAAQRAAVEPMTGAIASRLASDIYEVPVVADSIMDEPNNTTRFFVIGECDAQPSGADRTSLFFTIRDKVGALYQVLGVLQGHGLNMSYLESLPSRAEPWEYIFFVEMDGHLAEAHVRAAMERLEDLCRSVKILGSYPRGSFRYTPS